MKRKLSTQLSAGFILIVLAAISMISLSANLLINRQFEKYVEDHQKSFLEGMRDVLSPQYDSETGTWNQDYIHGFGMYALKDGYIVKLCDAEGTVIWDAENHDMTLCHQIMEEISTRMEEKRSKLNGDFVTYRSDLSQNGVTVGYLEVGYYSPYHLDDNDFQFLDSLNRILVIVGLFSIAGAAIAGVILARRLSAPIAKTTEITREISEGNYAIRFESSVGTRELAELSKAVNHMADALEQQEAIRRRLTTDVAHELRTPIANVSSYLEAILEGVWEPTPERLQSCYDELERLSMLVADLEKLRQAEYENLKLQKTPVDLLELSRTVVRNFETSFREKNICCTVAGDSAIVSADQARLQQVITNLVSNAVKYSHTSGNVKITVADREKEGILWIEDEGIGIPEEDQQMIFERFYRVDRSRSRRMGGAGIGLTIAKAIVQAHGGTIAVESRLGEGSRFKIVLPKAPEANNLRNPQID